MLKKIRNAYIIDLIFSHLRNTIKLNIIKYNNALLSRLNITKEDFKAYKNLKEFNEKYNLNIEDVDITELDLSNHHFGNKGLEYLAKIKFNKLRILELSHNQITDINLLEKWNLEKIIILNLIFNQISEINFLERVHFKELRELYLINNIISDINVLERVKFEKLEILNFGNKYKYMNAPAGMNSGNEISNINVLEKVNFKNLKVLNFSLNNIENINVLQKVKFKELRELNLNHNNSS